MLTPGPGRAVAVSAGAVLLLTSACAHAVRAFHPRLPAPQSSVVSADPLPRTSPTRASRSRPTAPGRQVGSGSLVDSTAFCETGLMAHGRRTFRGAVAGNRWPLGSRLRVSDSPYGPGVVEVADRIGHSSELDFAMPGDCAGARTWGRRTVRIEVVR